MNPPSCAFLFADVCPEIGAIPMRTRDRERLRRLRFVIRRLLEHGGLERGSQSRLSEHFGVSRQYIHQLVNEERERVEGLPGRSDDNEKVLRLSS